MMKRWIALAAVALSASPALAATYSVDIQVEKAGSPAKNGTITVPFGESAQMNLQELALGVRLTPVKESKDAVTFNAQIGSKEVQKEATIETKLGQTAEVKLDMTPKGSKAKKAPITLRISPKLST